MQSMSTMVGKRISLIAFVGLTACAAITRVGLSSPEAQITAGAHAGDAATVLVLERLKDRKITPNEGESYSKMLETSQGSLQRVKNDLSACRKETNSTPQTVPDPCWAKISDVVLIAVENITSIKRSLDAKK